jgi:hypothetical protein
MRSPFQVAVLSSLQGVLLPIVKLMLRCGVGCSEFVAVVKTVFVQAATEDYGLRGRPTNVSRVAAMTGLSRKEVRRIRSEKGSQRWTPDMEVTPANTVLHYWHFDPDFAEVVGRPRELAFEGERGFEALVKKYAGDIPPGAVKKELIRAGTIAESPTGRLSVKERYFYPAAFDEDFVRNAAFALKNLGETLVHNASLAANQGSPHAIRQGRFERFAWTDRLDAKAIPQFKQWARSEGSKFVELADDWIGKNEVIPAEGAKRRTAGIGVYYFEEDE